MRITNKIIQRNNLANINTNKTYQDKLSTQMSTQKKVNRPSDDPVVAIRALRLRSNVSEVTQYYSKNIPDAESWLSVTEDALKNLTAIITSMISQATKGSNGDLKTADRQIILEQLEALGDEVYTTGDADYAGRYVFTGYRTDTSLRYEKADTKNYTITEQLDNTAIDMLTKVNTGELLDWNVNNFDDAQMSNLNEKNIMAVDVHRLRLAYNDCNENGTVTIQSGKSVDANGNITFANTWTATMMHSHEDPYTVAANDPDACIFIPETGEVLLGDNKYNDLMAVKDDVTTVTDESEIRVSYEKKKWLAGDLRPEHYFACEDEKGLQYNQSYLTGDAERQDIEYDVGFNQTIRVNSTADECFKHGIGREVDDLIAAMQSVQDIEAVRAEIKQKLDEATEANKETLRLQYEAADKAYTLVKDKSQKMFESAITSFQGYLDEANLCITNCGTRSSKLELVKNRMQTQKTTFETLKSENEDADITEVAIQLSSAELTYEAALMATGKVMQTSLLNFI